MCVLITVKCGQVQLKLAFYTLIVHEACQIEAYSMYVRTNGEEEH